MLTIMLNGQPKQVSIIRIHEQLENKKKWMKRKLSLYKGYKESDVLW